MLLLVLKTICTHTQIFLMKTLLLSCFACLLFTIALKAQPVLQSTDINPVAGDKFFMVSAKTGGVVVPTAGKNKTWNYSKLVDSTAPIDTFRYMKKGQTPYGALFPQSNLAGTSSYASGNYVYYKTTTTLFEEFGGAGNGDTLTWNPPLRLAIYPATYNTHFTDTGTLTSQAGGTTFVENYRDSSKAVGYGTLKLPHNKTFSNVLMVRTTSIISYVVLGHHFVTTSHGVSFFVAGVHNPLITFSLSQNNQITSISYLKNVTPSFTGGISIDEEENITAANGISTSIRLYPNPATAAVTINFNDAAAKKPSAIFISDMNGQNVYAQQTNIFSGEKINCTAFKEGIYLVRVQMSDNTTEVQRLEIKK